MNTQHINYYKKISFRQRRGCSSIRRSTKYNVSKKKSYKASINEAVLVLQVRWSARITLYHFKQMMSFINNGAKIFLNAFFIRNKKKDFQNDVPCKEQLDNNNSEPKLFLFNQLLKQHQKKA